MIYTVLKSKENDLRAIQELSYQVKNAFVPILEIPAIGDDWLTRAHVQNKDDKVEYFCDCQINNISQALKNSAFTIDISVWPSNTKTAGGEHIYKYMSERFLGENSGYIASVNYSAWDDPEYRVAVTGFSESVTLLRLDEIAIQDASDTEFFGDRIDEIVSELTIDVQSCTALIDFGSLYSCDLVSVRQNLKKIVSMLCGIGFKKIGVGGGSIPAVITKVVPEWGMTTVPRYEEKLFKDLLINAAVDEPCYLDYGIRPAGLVQDFIAPHANGKIRYTIENFHVLFRGKAKSDVKLTVQYPLLALRLKDSKYFIPGYSWGDQQVEEYLTRKINAGSLGKWIAFDTNHHITFVSEKVSSALALRVSYFQDEENY